MKKCLTVFSVFVLICMLFINNVYATPGEFQYQGTQSGTYVASKEAKASQKNLPAKAFLDLGMIILQGVLVIYGVIKIIKTKVMEDKLDLKTRNNQAAIGLICLTAAVAISIYYFKNIQL